MEHLFTSESIISLLVLIILEIILGIDNVIFVSIIMNRMPKDKRKAAKTFWLIEGITIRILLLLALSWLLQQKGKIIFTLPVIDHGFDLASIVMLVGGLFLMWKSIKEIHDKMEADSHEGKNGGKQYTVTQGFLQILLIDMVFSFDSVITAGGTAKHIEIMVTAVVVVMFLMFYYSSYLANFIEQHPTIQILALSFLVLIGLSLVIEGWDPVAAHEMHLRNYIYFAMAFSVVVEMINMRFRKSNSPVDLNGPKESEVNMN